MSEAQRPPIPARNTTSPTLMPRVVPVTSAAGAPVVAPVPAGRRPLFALYAANAISQTGNIMMLVAVPWYVLATTGSAGRSPPT